jgi:hypothetical protein
MSNTKKLIFAVILIIGLIVLLFIGSSINTNTKKSDKFIGTLKSVNEKSIIVSGSFEDEKESVIPLYEYEIVVDSSAKIVKNSFVMPKGSEMFEVNKLPKETASVDFTTLKKDSENVAIGIEVSLNRNFFGAVKNIAKQITYIGPKY